VLEGICCLVLQFGSYAELTKCSKDLNMFLENNQSAKCVKCCKSSGKCLLVTGSACPCVITMQQTALIPVAALALHSLDTCTNRRDKSSFWQTKEQNRVCYVDTSCFFRNTYRISYGRFTQWFLNICCRPPELLNETFNLRPCARCGSICE